MSIFSKKTETKEITDGLQGPDVVDGETYLSQHDLYKLLAFERAVLVHTMKIAQLESHVAQLRAENEVRVRNVLKQKTDSAKLMQDAAKEYTAFRNKLATLYDIEDPSALTYDDETGRLTLPDKEE